MRRFGLLAARQNSSVKRIAQGIDPTIERLNLQAGLYGAWGGFVDDELYEREQSKWLRGPAMDKHSISTEHRVLRKLVHKVLFVSSL